MSQAGGVRRGLLAVCMALAGWPMAAPAQAPAPTERKALRVCQDPNNLPFSNAQGQGLENRIAEVFARKLNVPVSYFSYPLRFAFVRNTLRYKLPDQDYPCDIIMGVPVGFDQVSVTQPYYRSTYALVFAPHRALAEVRTAEDFLALEPTLRQTLRIGIYDKSPASQWVAAHGLLDQTVVYKMLDADPQQYPGQIIDKHLREGAIDAAVVWGPLAGYFAQQGSGTALRVVPLKSEKDVQFDYAIAMGVRYGEKAWKDQIDTLIASSHTEIQAILKEFGVPLVDGQAPSTAMR
ncbi:MAG: ABC transporter substrate-binding protein [Ideonella sp. MAG2]|nr:MAG: ABC transporter substrate-binding protein [Ideonella sp. MAG2]